MRFYSAMAVGDDLCNTYPLPSLKLPSNIYTDDTKVLIVWAHEEARTLIMTTLFSVQRNCNRLVQYTGVCKQNVQGTYAWLWDMCNTLVLVYSYIMNLNLPWSCIQKKKRRDMAAKQACAYFFFFFKFFFSSTVLKYVQLNWMCNWFKYECISLTSLPLLSFFVNPFLSSGGDCIFSLFSYPCNSEWGSLGGLGVARLMRQGLTQ